MDLFLYILFSAVYIMVIHFAMAIRKQFDLFQVISAFVLGGIIGAAMESYEMGFVAGVVLSLLIW